jgi:hypothetical protein
VFYCAPPPPAPPDPPPPVCGTPRAGCSALLPADELLVVVSAPVAVAGPVPVGATTVDPEPEVVVPAVPGTTTVPEGAVVDGAVEVWAKAVAAVKNAAEVNRASFVIAHLLTGFMMRTTVPWWATLYDWNGAHLAEVPPAARRRLYLQGQHSYTRHEVFPDRLLQEAAVVLGRGPSTAAFLMSTLRRRRCGTARSVGQVRLHAPFS